MDDYVVGHETQSSALELPVDTVCESTGQATQSSCVTDPYTFEYVSKSHLVHLLDPATSEYLPGSHKGHASLRCTFDALPGGHGSHEAPSSVGCVPGAHSNSLPQTWSCTYLLLQAFDGLYCVFVSHDPMRAGLMEPGSVTPLYNVFDICSMSVSESCLAHTCTDDSAHESGTSTLAPPPPVFAHVTVRVEASQVSSPPPCPSQPPPQVRDGPGPNNTGRNTSGSPWAF